MLNVALTETGAVVTDESVAVTRKEDWPAVVGVPEIARDVEMLIPSGRPEAE